MDSCPSPSVLTLDDLACACAVAAAGEEVSLVRALILALTRHAGDGLADLPSFDDLAALLDAGAADTAALRLAESAGGFLLSRGDGGSYLATVVLSGSVREISAGGSTAALALVGALASALSEADQSAQTPLCGKSRPGLHLN